MADRRVHPLRPIMTPAPVSNVRAQTLRVACLASVALLVGAADVGAQRGAPVRPHASSGVSGRASTVKELAPGTAARSRTDDVGVGIGSPSWTRLEQLLSPRAIAAPIRRKVFQALDGEGFVDLYVNRNFDYATIVRLVDQPGDRRRIAIRGMTAVGVEWSAEGQLFRATCRGTVTTFVASRAVRRAPWRDAEVTSNPCADAAARIVEVLGPQDELRWAPVH